MRFRNSRLRKVNRPGGRLVTELQKERRPSLIYLASRGRQRGDDLAARRIDTDEVRAEFRKSASGGNVLTAFDPVPEQRIEDAWDRLGGLTRGSSSSRKERSIFPSKRQRPGPWPR